MEMVLQTQQLCKKYKDQHAVDCVNMNIARGDIYGFVGENGAGKTTMIRLITGLIGVTSGKLKLFDAENGTKEMFEARKRMSAVVETPSIYLNLTARENMMLQAKLIGLTDLSFIDEVLKTVGLAHVANSKKKAKNYSLGMRQRLGIGIALLGNPDFIILDEPMNGLDPEGIVEVRELILKLNQERNITFLISSHILGELARVVTKYGFIHKGKLVKEISREKLEEECKKCLEFTVDNIGALTMVLENILDVHQYKILEGNVIRIYDEIEITDLAVALNEQGIRILTMNTKNENIEEYYLNLMGGLRNA